MLTTSKAFMYFVAFINLRAFDIVAFVAMLAIFYSYYRKSNVEGKRWLFCVGVAMLVSAIVMMVMLSALASGSNPDGGEMIGSVMKIGFFLVLWLARHCFACSTRAS